MKRNHWFLLIGGALMFISEIRILSLVELFSPVGIGFSGFVLGIFIAAYGSPGHPQYMYQICKKYKVAVIE